MMDYARKHFADKQEKRLAKTQWQAVFVGYPLEVLSELEDSGEADGRGVGSGCP